MTGESGGPTIGGMKTSIVISAAALAAIAPDAAATTFSGSCVAAGVVTMSSPVGYVPAMAGMDFVSQGNCTGTLDGKPVEGIRASGRSIGVPGPLSCLGGQSSGATTLRFHRKGRDAVLRMRFDDVAALTEAAFTLRGETSGIAVGRHQLTPDAALHERCAAGTLTRVGNTVSFATRTEVVG